MLRISGLSLLLGLSMASFAAGVEIVAHRGASYDAPENTLASVHLGWQQDADAVEIDIRLSSDDRIVAFHDKTTKRTAGGEDIPVSRRTFADLRRLDAGSWKDAKYAGERIPTLGEILQTIPDGKRLFIEIKTGPEILPELERVLDAAGKRPEQTPLISFSYETMEAAKRRFPELKVYWIVEVEQDESTGRWTPTAEELAAKAKRAGLDGIDFGNSPAVGEEFVRTLRDAGMEVYVWTVNDPEQAGRFRDIGVMGITTDRPGWLREQLGDAAAP
jgi:glycerophosphoryl diester phosphodiesterase